MQCADGTWRTLDGHELYTNKKSAGMIYQAILRNELTCDLGIAWGEVSKDGQADILGIPAPLLEAWSKRSHSVNTDAARAIGEYEALLGRDLTGPEKAAVIKVAVLKTRPDKTHEHPESLTARWTAEAAAVGVDLSQLLPLAQAAAGRAPGTGSDGGRSPRGPAGPPLGVDEIATAALTAAGRSRAVFGRADVAGQVAALLPTLGLPAEEVLATIERVTDRALELSDSVPVGAPVHGVTSRASDARYATVEILTAEQRILTLARDGQHIAACAIDPTRLRTHLDALPSRLDSSQLQALLHLLRSGDALDVLTAPAGAGKTNTHGACAALWAQHGYRVVGLAPSARAAAELSAALHAEDSGDGSTPTGRADTLAKWLHTRAQQPDLDHLDVPAAGKPGWARLDHRTVLIVDEASMASTLDLDTLTQAANAAGAKVVLVGDPAQIGVINGPGGMLAHLARDGHALALTEIHRFTNDWERAASLHLREGQPDALDTYWEHDRLHPCPDGATAADQLFAHWQHAISQGADALMLARTRIDVDALNTRARLAAMAAGQLVGVAVVRGGREWQAGDLLRTRRNQRTLPVGDSHVRNGDRYQVLGTSPDGGLVVEDLSGRGRCTLPATYVARHCEYGWAATIDGSQGATCDVGLVLARPGLDREHLYVALTRGRHANHAYLTPDPTDRADGDIPPPTKHRLEGPEELERDCLRMLHTALATSGAQDSALTALQNARDAASRQPRPTEAPPAAAAGPLDADSSGASRSEEDRRRAEELAAARQLLAGLQQQHGDLSTRRRELEHPRAAVTGGLSTLPRGAVLRRQSLARRLADLDTQLAGLRPAVRALEQQITAAEDRVVRLHRDCVTPAPGASPSPTPRPVPHPTARISHGSRPAPPPVGRSIARRPDPLLDVGEHEGHEPRRNRDRDTGRDL
ncbi:MAG: AAA family ATPase [Mycobacteriales bacterium]